MTMKNESGRSMVEMLGVLAIIGVLSIGGIAGYTMAMNRYRANEIIDAASKVSVIGMTQTGADTADLTDIGSPSIYCVTGITAGQSGAATITFDNNCSDVVDAVASIAGGKYTTGANNTGTLNFDAS